MREVTLEYSLKMSRFLEPFLGCCAKKKKRQITRNLKAPTPCTIKVARNSAYPTFSKLFSFSIICWRNFSEAKAAWYPATLSTVHGVSRFLGNHIINAKRVTGGLESRKALSINAPTWTSYLSEFRNNVFFFSILKHN